MKQWSFLLCCIQCQSREFSWLKATRCACKITSRGNEVKSGFHTLINWNFHKNYWKLHQLMENFVSCCNKFKHYSIWIIKFKSCKSLFNLGKELVKLRDPFLFESVCHWTHFQLIICATSDTEKLASLNCAKRKCKDIFPLILF